MRLALTVLALLGLFLAAYFSMRTSSESKISVAQLQAHPELLQQFIANAYRDGARKIKIPPGIYRLGESSHGSCLYFEGLKNVEIDATGVTLVATSVKSRILFLSECDGVTLTGGTFTRDPMGFSQGRIEAISADRKAVDIRIPRGYPMNVDAADYFGGNPKMLGLFDPVTRDWIRGADDVWFKEIQRLGADLFRFQLPNALAANYPIAVGDLAAWRGYGQESVVFQLCQNLKIIGITIYNSGGFCLHEQGGGGNNYYQGCKIARGPAPEGADKNETPLFSSACDGYHSTAMHKGPTYENCSVEFNDDDGFAIHGHGSLVVEGKGNSIIVGHLVPQLAYRVGETLRLYDQNGSWAGDARVVEAQPVSGYTMSQDPPKTYRLFNLYNKNLWFQQVQLDHSLAAGFGWLGVNPDMLGQGCIIRNCGVYHNRWRGIFLRASDSLVENCVVDGPTAGGIVLMPEVEYWDEVDFVRNAVIRNNTIRDVGLWKMTLGALDISAWTFKGPVPFPGGHQDILVENNTFDRNDGINVVIGSAQRITFRNNLFNEPLQHDKVTGFGAIPSESLYGITESSDITIEGNRIVHPGPWFKKVVNASPSSRNIKEN